MLLVMKYRIWFLEQIADIIDASNRRKMLKFIRKMHVSDQNLHVEFELFSDSEDIINCVNHYIIQINILSAIENLVELVGINNPGGALQIVLNFRQYLTEIHYFDKFSVKLVYMKFSRFWIIAIFVRVTILQE